MEWAPVSLSTLFFFPLVPLRLAWDLVLGVGALIPYRADAGLPINCNVAGFGLSGVL